MIKKIDINKIYNIICKYKGIKLKKIKEKDNHCNVKEIKKK
jgi:hypothetical protein